MLGKNGNKRRKKSGTLIIQLKEKESELRKERKKKVTSISMNKKC